MCGTTDVALCRSLLSSSRVNKQKTILPLRKKLGILVDFTCLPCAGAMLTFSVLFQFYRMIPEGNPANRASAMHTLSRISET